jgi:hypothetical protein
MPVSTRIQRKIVQSIEVRERIASQSDAMGCSSLEQLWRERALAPVAYGSTEGIVKFNGLILPIRSVNGRVPVGQLLPELHSGLPVMHNGLTFWMLELTVKKRFATRLFRRMNLASATIYGG